MATDALTQNINTTAGLSSLFQSLFGKSGSVYYDPTTETKQTQFSAEALKALLSEKLAGIQGLEAVAGGQKRAGLYNTSTSQLLINDLLVRSAAEVAKQAAPTVTTKVGGTKKTTVPGVLPSGLAPVAGIAALAMNKDVQAGANALLKLLSPAKDMAGFMNTDSLASAFSTIASADSYVPSYDLSALGLGDAAGSISMDGFSGLASLTENLPSAYGDVFDTAATSVDAMSSFGIPLGSAIKALSGDVEGALGSAALYSIPVAGPVLAAADSLLGLNIGSTVGEAAGDIAEGIGGAVTGIGDAVGDVVEGIFGGCFITTAVCEALNKSDDCEELQALRKFRDTWLKDNHPEDITAYYAEAPGIVQKLKKRADAAYIFTVLYFFYIVDAVADIQVGDNEGAYETYSELFKLAARLADGAERRILNGN